MGTWTRRGLLTGAAAAGFAHTGGTAPARAAGRARRPRRDELTARLGALPGLRVVEERADAPPGYRHLVLGLCQPVDHARPRRDTFEQRLTLLHTSATRPTILFTTGYEAVLAPRLTEAATLLHGNQVQVEHRHFGTSRPPGTDLTHLTIRQAADDHHRVVRLLRTLYLGAWISTGSSKGGMASVYHRRFHPHDVDGTLAHSAPHNVDDGEDSAYHRFLDRAGTPAQQQALADVQRRLLQHRAELVLRYENESTATGATFRIIGDADKAFEIAVLRAPFMFWQNGTATAHVPGPDAGPEELYRWLDAHARLTAYTDPVVRAHVPYFYQLGTQLGYWDPRTDHLADLLRHPGAPRPRTFVPADVPMRFDPVAMPDVDRWVRRHGERLLFVNGTRDPAVAEPFRPGPRDSRVLWAPDTNHRAALADLTPADRATATAMLTRWARVPRRPRRP
ncbi:S28 family serine protease [Streptomyces sp. NPDC002490]|uniref:S28 family serine protease n=1 Tax=Streptomyces sp. NPDC002490 TaxID=3154416 RepID=UPI003324509A